MKNDLKCSDYSVKRRGAINETSHVSYFFYVKKGAQEEKKNGKIESDSKFRGKESERLTQTYLQTQNCSFCRLIRDTDKHSTVYSSAAVFAYSIQGIVVWMNETL